MCKALKEASCARHTQKSMSNRKLSPQVPNTQLHKHTIGTRCLVTTRLKAHITAELRVVEVNEF